MTNDVDDISPNEVVTGKHLEALLKKEKEKYLKIINDLTDEITQSGCEIEHPFDRESMTIINSKATTLENNIRKALDRLDYAFKQAKVDKFDYLYIKEALEGKE